MIRNSGVTEPDLGQLTSFTAREISDHVLEAEITDKSSRGASTGHDLKFVQQPRVPFQHSLRNPLSNFCCLIQYLDFHFILGFDRTNPETHGSYCSTAKHLCNWLDKDGFLPKTLQDRISRITNGANLSSSPASSTVLQQTFVENDAIFHQKCVVRYTAEKLKRKLDQSKNEEVVEKLVIEPKITRRSFNASNFTKTCFFCGEVEDLITCRTLTLYEHVKIWATFLSDARLLAKLSEGDIVATEAQYHKKCLTGVFNQYRSKKREEVPETELLRDIEQKALGDVVEYIKDQITVCIELESTPVFTQKSLSDMYNSRLVHHGADEEFTKRTHCTHLRERIMEAVPGLRESKDGRNVILSVDDDVGKAIFDACENSSEEDRVIISRAAKLIRKLILKLEEKTFDGNVTDESQTKSVPNHLIKLLSMVLEGGNYDREISPTLKSICVNISQLIRFNTVRQVRGKEVAIFRHSTRNEPPFPVLLALMIHAATRKKKLVDWFAEAGMSVSYDRLLDIRGGICEKICEEYEQNDQVCPTSEQEGVFISTAVDNLDHNKTSTESETSIHVTTLSVFQHLTLSMPSEHKTFDLKPQKSRRKGQLPQNYTDIKPTRESKPEPPKNDAPSFDSTASPSLLENASSWLSKLVEVPNDPLEEPISFSSYYSREQSDIPVVKTSCHLLPIIPEPVTSHATVRHCAKQLVNVTERLNPGQKTVITADQQVYTIGKELQYQFPEEFKNVLWLLGPLHIEKNFLEAIGKWLDGSGWKEIYEYSTIATAGKADALLKCAGKAGIKRARYAQQVTLAALHSLSVESFQNQSEFLNFDAWRESLEAESATAKFWFTVIDMDIILFMFVRSIRETDFELFRKCLEEMKPWLAALDHINYFRWLSIFLRDIEVLQHSDKDFYELLSHNFTIKKSERKFSAIGIDQAHEQNNKIVKTDGGAIGIFENEQALLDWTITGPYVADMISNFSSNKNRTSKKHHEDTPTFENKFRRHRSLLIDAFKQFGSPFEDPLNELQNIVSKQIYSEAAANSVINARKDGSQQSEQFLTERIKKSSKPKSLYDTITKNQLSLFHVKNTVSASKSKQEKSAIQDTVRLYSSLYVGCQTRKGNMDDFFQHENHSYPPSLSDLGKIRKTPSKSDFLDCLPPECKLSNEYSRPAVDAIIVDGPGVVQKNPPRKSTTFGDYCRNEIGEKFRALAGQVKRVDVVFDVYRKDSRKRETREGRGKKKGVRISIQNNTPIYRKFNQILSVDENKNELNNLIATSTVELCASVSNVVVVTKGESLVSNHPVERQRIDPCTKEEADDRMFLHAMALAREGYKKLCVVSTDSDVVIIALYSFWHLDIDELWIEFGADKDRRWLPIHTYARILGEPICHALPFWHAFTGCDTVSQFSGRAKKTAWTAWSLLPEATHTFSTIPHNLEPTEDDMRVLELFVVFMYDQTCPDFTVNGCRKYLFTKLGRLIENCPPTLDALTQHIKRAILQSNIWVESLYNTTSLDITNFGWSLDQECSAHPVWCTLAKSSVVCKELKKCKCKKTCSQKCTCKTFGLPCTDLCSCGGKCYAT